MPVPMQAVDMEGAAANRPQTQESWARWRPDFSSPSTVLPVCWLLGLALAQIRLLHVQQPWSRTAWLVMLWTPVAFFLGGVIGGNIASLAVKPRVNRPSAAALAAALQSRRSLLLISALTTIGLAGVAYQFAHARDIPLFTSHIDAARTSLPGGPSIAALDALVVAATLALVAPERLISRAAVPYVVLAALALGALALTGGRGNVVVPPVVAGLARWQLGRRPAMWSLAAVVVLMLGAFSIVFYLRAGQEAHQAWATELLGHVVYHMPAPLVPLFPIWVAVAMNFNTLARVVAHYPRYHPFGHGIYDSRALHMFLHSAPLNAGKLTPPWTLSTFAGPLWADGGFIALTLGVGLIGCLTTFICRAGRRHGGLGYLLVSCYMLFLAVFCLYQNLFTVYIDWIVVTVGLAVAGMMLAPGNTLRGREERLHALLQHVGLGLRPRSSHHNG